MITKTIKITTLLILTTLLSVNISCSSETAEALNEINDRDGDSVPDSEDLCPDVAGLVSLNGCPEEEIVEDVWTVNQQTKKL